MRFSSTFQSSDAQDVTPVVKDLQKKNDNVKAKDDYIQAVMDETISKVCKLIKDSITRIETSDLP